MASDTLEKIKVLIRDGRVLVSAHGYDELAADDILFSDVIGGLIVAELVEDYPSASKGRAFWFCIAIRPTSRSMPFGAFPKAPPVRLCS